jgi:hypothetical protein
MTHRISLAETLYLSATLSINNIGLAIAGGIGGIGYGPAMLSIFGFSVFMLALGQALGDRMEDVLPIRPKLSNEMLGSAVLFVAGALMIAGF